MSSNLMWRPIDTRAASLPKELKFTLSRPIKVPVNDVAKIDRIKYLMAKIGGQWEEGHKAPAMTHPPIRDALFVQVAEDEGLAGIDGNWRAALTFYGENG